jgi:hypothetical protein
MAIVKTAVPGTRKVVGGNTMITVSPQGGQIAQKSSNNRAKGSKSRAKQTKAASTQPGTEPQIPSPGFQGLDQEILSLDGNFDLLEDKSGWETLAGNIAGEWQLCANCMPDSAAKKLFRQYNFNRARVGKPTLINPVDDTAFALSAEMDIVIFLTQSTGAYMAQIGWTDVDGSDAEESTIFIIQWGMTLSNPARLVLLSEASAPQTTGPLLDWLLMLGAHYGPMPALGGNDTNFFNACVANSDGAPGLINPCVIQRFTI